MGKSGKPTLPQLNQTAMNETPDDMADALSSALGDREQFPMNVESVAALTMKCGSPQLAVRKKLHDEIAVPFIPEEGFAVFQTKVERHFAKLGPIYVQEKRAIYMKPSSNATQSKYLLLTKDNFESVLRMRWKISKSMKTELKYEVFCYFIDTTSKKDKRRRMMIQQQQQQQQQQGQPIKQFQPDQHGALLVDGQTHAALLSNGGVGLVGGGDHSFLSFGALSNSMQGYAEVAASLVESAGARKSGIPTLRQSDGGASDRPRKMARVARQTNGPFASSPLVVDASEDSFFVPIPFRINGIDIPIEIDLAALKRNLALVPPARDAAPPSPASGSTQPAGTSPQCRR